MKPTPASPVWAHYFLAFFVCLLLVEVMTKQQR